MADATQIPYLLQLLDDESRVVHDAIGRELAEFGPRLEEVLQGLEPPATPAQLHRLRGILAERQRAWLRTSWPRWYAVDGDKERLELALSLVAEFQDGAGARTVSGALNSLAVAFSRRDASHDAAALAHFLFQEKRLRGAKDDYYDARNSNLAHVIETRSGNPISLACIYILVGHRLGLEISGCNWPGHFLARTSVEGVPTLVDCYNRGTCVAVESFLKMQGPSRDAAEAVVDDIADVETIIARVLNNLIRAYAQAEDWDSRELMIDLLRDMQLRQEE